MLKFFLILLHLSFAIQALNYNEIRYPTINSDNIYKFFLEIEEAISMSIWNENRHDYDPVINKDGAFFVRNSNYADSCDSLTIVNNTKQLDSIVIGGGLHRHLLLVNKTLPGPAIIVPHNSNVEITVKNKLMSEFITLHWHGITQKNTFFMDGVARVTQCPIAPGDTFTYKFKATESGTHWFHSHAGVQRTEGMYAPLIVTEESNKENEAIKFDKEFLFVIQDLFHEYSNDLIHYYNNGNMKFGYDGYSDFSNECYRPTRMDDGSINAALPYKGGRDTIIINGKGSYKLFKKSKNLEEVDLNLGRTAFNYNLDEFEVEPNKAYLFRVIGANSGLTMRISIGGHKMTLVAVDGNKIKSIRQVDSLIVDSGERFDFYIETKDYSDQINYFIVVQTIEKTDYFFNKLNYSNYGLAILKYKNAFKKTVKCLDACKPLNSESLVANCPFWNSNLKGLLYKCLTTADFKSLKVKESDKHILKSSYDLNAYERFNEFEEHFINLGFAGINSLRSSINGKRFVQPTGPPPFFSADFNSHYTQCSSNESTSECTNNIRIGRNKTIQFVISNMGTGTGIDFPVHPFHFHGHHFYVIALGFPSYNEYLLNEQNEDLTCVHNELCYKPKWRNETWQMGNAPHANLIDPPLRDTLTIPKGGYAVIRFASDNPGIWLLHCHIEMHMAQGMSMLIQSGSNDEIRNLANINSKDIDVCGKINSSQLF